MSRLLRVRFERGGELEISLLNDLAPKTIESVLELLPLTNMVYHSRWSGREINTEIKTGKRVSRENQTMQTAPGDVVYWREWEKEGDDVAEAVAIYYGPELTRYHKGPQLVNVFGSISQSQWRFIEEIGLRIWRHGGEKLTITYEELP